MLIDVKVEVDPYDILSEIGESDIKDYLLGRNIDLTFDEGIADRDFYYDFSHKAAKHEIDMFKLIDEVGADKVNEDLECAGSNLRLVETVDSTERF